MTDVLPSPTAPATRPSVRARLILILLCAAQFAISIDFSILNVALPSLGADLGLSAANLQWAVTAFALPSGGFLLLAGRLGDLVGRRRMFLIGLVIFAAASLLATLAVGPAMFLTARALQGLGAAITIPTAMALLTTNFAEGPARNRALGISGMILSLGFTLGMLLGGTLTSTLGWRSTMALNVIMAIPVLIAAPLLLTESRPARAPRLDIPGAVTVTGGLLALIYAVSTGSEHGWARPDVLIGLVAAVVGFVAFAIVENRAAEPLVSLAILRRRTVAWGNLGGMATFSMASSLTFLLTLFLQEVDGLSPFRSGLIFGVTGLGAAGAGVLASRMINRFAAHRILTVGLLFQGLATAVMIMIGRGNGVVLVLIFCTAAFFGHMFSVVSYGVAATSGLPNREQGLATGLLTTAQQVGLTLGIPIMSAISAARSAGLRADGATPTQAMLGGLQSGIAADGAILVVAAILMAAFLRPRADRSLR
ncbi:MFS transporter [Microlunatus soli]|uniref:Drug resistance transporter, EmrB/QacA subfamily n=1 Tax=Microlunatus soli TaxID=630515 RepID=A0A1H1ZTP1_9ACTN|nr:MFS transporter [Microlunatus soli]SDT36646.1 drug resistance transporter, EmrB/QacA subfamily [Microlunatus soli]